jgi:hypothetical protein
MIWTQIFKNHYLSFSDKSKQNWIMALSDTFVYLILAEKEEEEEVSFI